MNLKTLSEYIHGIGESVRELRFDRRMRQADLAKLSDTSVNTVRRLERGESISLIHFLSILSALDVDLSVVARWIPQPKAESLEDFMESDKPQRVRVR